MTEKLRYVEPKDAPIEAPCRFCDLPSNVDDLGPVVKDGTAIDGERPLFSHRSCLMDAGGKKSDDQDFSLKPESEEENIWAFASQIRTLLNPEDDVKIPKLSPEDRLEDDNGEGTDHLGI